MGAVDDALALASKIGGGSKKAKAPTEPEPAVLDHEPEPEVKAPEPEVKAPEPEVKAPEPEAGVTAALTGFAKKRAKHPDLIACKVKGTVPVRGIARFDGEFVLVTQSEFDRYAKKLKKIS